MREDEILERNLRYACFVFIPSVIQLSGSSGVDKLSLLPLLGPCGEEGGEQDLRGSCLPYISTYLGSARSLKLFSTIFFFKMVEGHMFWKQS